jgi:hypothetical protein
MFPGITHEQYLDEVTMDEVQWMVRIHQLVKADEDRRTEKTNP